MDTSKFFSEGRGRGFDIPERKELPATNKDRTMPVLIDLEDLNKPGVGPLDYDEPRRGRRMPSLTKNAPEGQPSNDID